MKYEIVVIAKAEFRQPMPGESILTYRKNVSSGNQRSVVRYLDENYEFLKYIVSPIFPSITITVDELDDNSINKLLVDLRSLESVETAEKVQCIH